MFKKKNAERCLSIETIDIPHSFSHAWNLAYFGFMCKNFGSYLVIFVEGEILHFKIYDILCVTHVPPPSALQPPKLYLTLLDCCLSSSLSLGLKNFAGSQPFKWTFPLKNYSNYLSPLMI